MTEAHRDVRQAVAAYRAFQEANRAAVDGLNQLCRFFTAFQATNIRSNEPFRIENVRHRCEKRRRVESVSRALSRRIFRDLDAIDGLVRSFARLTGLDATGFERRAADLREAFLRELWYLRKLLLHSLCDDTAYTALQKQTVALLTEIRRETLTRLLAGRPIDPADLASLNEIARVLHHRGDEWFFRRVRRLGRVRDIPLAGSNALEVLDLNALEDGDEAWDPDDPSSWPAPALRALVRPYRAGAHGAGQETLNVVALDGLVDTQFTLGLHKARLRSLIVEGDASRRNFISLSYFEPPQTVYSQNIGKRLRYFGGLLERMDFAVDTDYLSYLNATFHGHSSLASATLSEVMRAIISLKDLDEVEGLTDGYGTLLDLFEKGVTNLHSYLALVRYFRQFLAGRLDRDSFRMILLSQRLNPSDLRVFFDKEAPALLARARRTPEEVPRLMRFLQSVREERPV